LKLPPQGITRKARTPDDGHANLFANDPQKSKKAKRAGFSLKFPPQGITVKQSEARFTVILVKLTLAKSC